MTAALAGGATENASTRPNVDLTGGAESPNVTASVALTGGGTGNASAAASATAAPTGGATGIHNASEVANASGLASRCVGCGRGRKVTELYGDRV